MSSVFALLVLIRYWYIFFPCLALIIFIAARIRAIKEKKQQEQQLEAEMRVRIQAEEKRRQAEAQRRKQEYAREYALQQYREQEALIEKERRKAVQLQKEQERKEKQLAMSDHQRFITEQRRLMTDSLRYDILARDKFRCQICGISAAEGAKLHVDHIFPVSKGGKSVPSNLRTLCERCNLGKSDKIEAPVSQQPHSTSQESNSTKSQISSQELLSYLESHNIKWIDNRDRGGCLWIETTDKSSALLLHTLVDGKPIQQASKSKVFGNKPAFFLK